jgi:hypothetical protein
MAATIFGFSTGEIKPQPGLSISRSESGGWSATHEIAIKASDFANVENRFQRGAFLVELDPSVPQPFDTFLRIDTVTFVRAEGDLIIFNITATGGVNQFQGEEGELSQDAEPNYTLTGQLQDAPFSMHPKWELTSDNDKAILGQMLDGILRYDKVDDIVYRNDTGEAEVANVKQFDPPDEDNISRQFAQFISQGQETYVKSVYTWTETTEGLLMLTNAQLNKLGKIATPRGNPPKPAAETRDWMLTSVSQSQAGLLYRTTLEWTLSERGGHSEFLYDDIDE